MKCIDEVISDVRKALKVIPNGTNSTIRGYYIRDFPFASGIVRYYNFFVAIDHKSRIKTARYTIVDPSGLVYCFDDNDAVNSVHRCVTDDDVAREISRIVSLMLEHPPTARYYLGEDISNFPIDIARSGILYLSTAIPYQLIASDSVVEKYNASIMLLVNQHAEALAAVALNLVMRMITEVRHEYALPETVDSLTLNLIVG